MGVYGLVAGIVKLDDLGIHLIDSADESRFSKLRRRAGEMILRFAPIMMKSLAVLGTAAMFLVGGGILVHGIPLLAAWGHGIEDLVHGLPVAANVLSLLAVLIFNAIVGILAGGIIVGIHSLATRVLGSKS